MITRLKQLREVLKLSQAKFAEKIGLKQGTVGDIEAGRNKLTERNFEIICHTFNVNPEWLSNGAGEMFNVASSKNFLDNLTIEKHLDDREKALIKSLIELPDNVREGVIDWALNLAKEINSKNYTQQKIDTLQKLIAERDRLNQKIFELSNAENEIDDNLPRDKKIALVNQELDAAEKRKMLSVSTISNGRVKQNKL